MCGPQNSDTHRPGQRDQRLGLKRQQDGKCFLKLLYFTNIVSRRYFPFIGFIAKPGYHWIMNLEFSNDLVHSRV